MRKAGRKQGDSALWTPRERMAAALIGVCDPKTVDRYLDGRGVRANTADLLMYSFGAGDDPVPILRLLQFAEQLTTDARALQKLRRASAPKSAKRKD